MIGAEHPAAVAWRKLAGSEARPDEIVAFERRWKKRRARPVYRLQRRTEPAFDVVAKPCRSDEALRTAVIYRHLLPYVPIRCPHLLGIVPGDADDRSWLFFEWVEAMEYEPADRAHRRLAGRWLATLHTTAAEVCGGTRIARLDYLYDLDSPGLREHLSTIAALLDDALTGGAFSDDDARLLRSLDEGRAALERHWSALEDFTRSVPRTLVHGDFCVSNMLVSHEDRLVVFDWQRSGWASPAFDLTRFLGSWADPDLEAYLDVTGRHWPGFDAGTVRRLAYVGEILRWVEAVRWDVAQLGGEWTEGPLSRLRVYQRWMRDILEAAPWTDDAPLGGSGWRSAVPYERPARLAPGAPVHA